MSKKLNDIEMARMQEHFTVPEGYFGQFAANMVDKLPEQPFQEMHLHSNRKRTFRAAAAIAACAVAMVIGIGPYFSAANNVDDAMMSSVETMVNAESFDDASEYAVIDRHDISYFMMIEN